MNVWDEVVELKWLEQYVPWREGHLWLADHIEVPLLLSLTYLVGIFSTQWMMKNREPFELKTPLFLWNMLLAVFSFLGALGTIPHMWRIIKVHGITYDLCTYEAERMNPWIFLFGLSKIPELLDTFFIVLRKRPLIFLHYYHHVITMIYCWHGLGLQVPGGWFAAMNLVIHTIMYSYYAACAYGVRFGEITRLSITTLQILQMVLGLAVIGHNLVMCDNVSAAHQGNYYFGLLMYVSFFVLFVKLFVDSYITKKRRKPSSSAGSTTTTNTRRAKKID